MPESAQLQRLTVIVSDSDFVGRRPMFSEILRRAQEAGMAGCSVMRGIEGFGESRVIHTTHILSLSDSLPVSVVIVDAQERIDDFVKALEDLVDGGLITIEDVTAIRSSAGSERPGR